MKKPEKFFIAVAGNIGSGKSSLTRILSERFGWKPYFESVEDNPYLTDFYADMKRWSFNLQVYFLSNRFRSHKAITEGPDSVILDRAIYEDAEIFARNLYDIGSMERRDYQNYVALYDVMTAYLRPPDLLIYLRANVDTLVRQIALRGRDFEEGVPRAAQPPLRVVDRALWAGSAPRDRVRRRRLREQAGRSCEGCGPDRERAGDEEREMNGVGAAFPGRPRRRTSGV
jgi:deoxyadenosine/deoxycytidine kinase